LATTLKFLILGDDQASGAFDRFARSVDKANRAAGKNTESLKEQEAQSSRLSRTVDSLSTSMSGLGSPLGAAVVAGAALAPVAVTLGAGLGGLGLAALSASKHTQAMGVILGPLKQEVRDFQNSLQPEVFTLFGDGAGIARDVLKELQPVAAATGSALHGVLGEVGAEFKSGEWQQFFQFMEQQAGPDLQLVGKLFIDLAKDVPPLLEQLQPLGRVVLILADVVLRAVGGLEKMHLVLPVVGAAAGLLLGGGPIGALIGAFAGLAIQEYSAARATKQVATEFEAVARVTMPSSAAVSVDWAAVAGSLGKTAVSAADVANAMIDLHPRIGTIRGDMDLLNASVGSGNVILAAYSDLWDKFVGKSVSDQQAILNMQQAFESFNAAVKASGRTSTAAQQAFLAIFTTIGSGLDALHQNGASVKQLNDYYTTSIDRLNALHGLTPVQRADVQGLARDYLAWANTVHGLSGNVVTAAGSIRDTLLAQLAMSHRLVPQAAADATQLASAILKTGDNSRATAVDRAQLIKDFEKSGLTAIQAQQAAVQFQRQIDALHGKTVNVNLTTSGHGQIIITGTGINQRQINTSTGTLRAVGGHAAAGMLVSGGVPGRDSVLVNTMPGELIVPAHLVAAGAVDHLRGRIPGFAAGGVVGKVSGAESGIASADATWAALAATAFAQAAIKAQQAALPGFLGPGSGNYAADIATVLSAMGLPLSLVPNWERQIQTESGGNLRAVNLTDSNAAAGHPSVGLLQLIPGTFAAYAGPYLRTPPLVNYGGGFVSLDPMAQIYAGIHYADARYDGSMASVIGHGHGYALGTASASPGWAWVGERGPELVRFRGGEQVRPVPGGGNTYNITVNVPVGAHPAQAGKEVIRVIREYENVNGAGWRALPP
jgi:SLT domain-containing protein